MNGTRVVIIIISYANARVNALKDDAQGCCGTMNRCGGGIYWTDSPGLNCACVCVWEDQDKLTGRVWKEKEREGERKWNFYSLFRKSVGQKEESDKKKKKTSDSFHRNDSSTLRRVRIINIDQRLSPIVSLPTTPQRDEWASGAFIGGPMTRIDIAPRTPLFRSWWVLQVSQY